MPRKKTTSETPEDAFSPEEGTPMPEDSFPSLEPTEPDLDTTPDLGESGWGADSDADVQNSQAIPDQMDLDVSGGESESGGDFAVVPEPFFPDDSLPHDEEPPEETVGIVGPTPEILAMTMAENGGEDTPEEDGEIPYGEDGETPGEEDVPDSPPEYPASNQEAPRNPPQRGPAVRRDAGSPDGGRAPGQLSEAAADRAAFFGLDFNELDRNLTPEQRQEWNSIYASYRGRSVMTGVIADIDRTQVRVRDPSSGEIGLRRLYCAVVIPYRVRVLIPETEMWAPNEERPNFVLRNMPGAVIDFVIIRVDRENNLAVASRRMALPTRRYYFSTQPSMNRPGSRIQCRVLAVGPRRCLVSCNGYDMDLTQRDLSYKPVPDLREAYHTGDSLDCVVKHYDGRDNRLEISVKETAPNPFDGAEFRHPAGCSRQAVISGKYGGGVFCTLPDDVTVMCNYAFHYDDSVFHIGDRVILLVDRYDDRKKQVYGKIVAKS